MDIRHVAMLSGDRTYVQPRNYTLAELEGRFKVEKHWTAIPEKICECAI